VTHTFSRLSESDIELVRVWRNEQQTVLRQQRPITPEEQLQWFRGVVEPGHASSQPRFLLFSMRVDGALAGYGGLTNIDWTSRRAEVSFLVETARSLKVDVYERDLDAFLGWLRPFAFGELQLNRLFTETFAFRDGHIGRLEANGWRREGCLRQHVLKQGRFHDSIVHGLLASDEPQCPDLSV
jgi:RimJ/RimL family protein N-acetyltransferase